MNRHERLVVVRLAVVLLSACLAVSIPLLAPPTARAAGGTYWQVGALATDSSDEYASGIGSYLGHYPLPQYEPSGAVVFIWAGGLLGDGSFFQSGTTTNYGNCPTNEMEEFAQAWLPNGTREFAITLDCGVTIPSFSLFSVYESASVGIGIWRWYAAGPSGQYPGSAFDVGSATTGSHEPESMAELSGSTISSSSQLGPVGADPAIVVEFSAGPWTGVGSARAYYAFQGACPPLNVIADGWNWISMGTGLNNPCNYNGVTLW